MPDFQDAYRQIMGFIAMGILGLLGRTLVSPEPFDARRFTGEMILTALGAIMLFALGVLQGLDTWQMIVLGAGTSLGGLRAIEWGFKIVQAAKVRP